MLELYPPRSLIFVEPSKSAAFDFRGHKVVKTGFALSHGQVITSTACQGRTVKKGVVIDCGRRVGGQSPTHDDDFWLHLYVMLSRATRLEDILLVRAPASDFLLKGPPPGLARQLEKFAARTSKCRETAARLSDELGFRKFLHD